jgi:hypothetical protein
MAWIWPIKTKLYLFVFFHGIYCFQLLYFTTFPMPNFWRRPSQWCGGRSGGKPSVSKKKSVAELWAGKFCAVVASEEWKNNCTYQSQDTNLRYARRLQGSKGHVVENNVKTPKFRQSIWSRNAGGSSTPHFFLPDLIHHPSSSKS